MFQDDEEVQLEWLNDEELGAAIKKNPMLATTLRLYNDAVKKRLLDALRPSPFEAFLKKEKNGAPRS